MEPLSVIIPTFNSQQRLPALLQSLRDQNLDQRSVELIVVDDESTDSTREIAERFGATIVMNGARHIERGKALGMAAASHDLLLFIDDDNRLPHPRWLERAIGALVENPNAVGAQAAWFAYTNTDPAANRYCSLYGIGDPMAFYLRRRDHLMTTERNWAIAGHVVRETDRYWLVRFTPQEFPTIGSQGYLTRKSTLITTDWWPALWHIDCNYELVVRGRSDFVFLKDEVVHEYCRTADQIVRKCRRNMELFLRYAPNRRYRWETPAWKLVATVARMVTVVGPAMRSAYDFVKTGDVACFLHPYLSFVIPLMYTSQILAFKLAGRKQAAEPM